MKKKHDSADKVKDEGLAAMKEKLKNGGHLSRVFKLSSPKSLILVGTLFSWILGGIMPFFGIFIGKMLFVLQPIPPVNPDELI
jgi:hypothetical protein